MGSDRTGSQTPRAQDTQQAALDSFIDKWRVRWPEWAVAAVFVPRRQQPVALAWAALLQELTDAAWAGADARPGEAKLAWWMEELHGWSQGARRHPLGIALQRQPAPWDVLAASLPALQRSRERPHDLAEACSAIEPLAEAATAVEAALFDLADAESGHAVEATRDAVCASLLQARFFHEGDDHVPLAVFARAGEGAPAAIWAQQLRHRWPQKPAASRPRRIWAGLARARLRQSDPTRPMAAWRALALAWRAARGSARN
jgi:hypothetical protein